jgi:branched-chain amino acid transport system ATP-binding protein
VTNERTLSVRDVHTYYGDSHVLHGVTLTAEVGRLTALMGRNGAGKTTLLGSISGLTPPRNGEIRFEGNDLTGLKPYQIARLGVSLVPQGRRVFGSLSVREHLDIVNPSGRAVTWTAERVLDVFPQLKTRWNQRASHLSGGEQSMLAIARALRLQPTCLLMDEPMEGLSPVYVQIVANVIQALRNEAERAILLVIPELALAVQLADRICIMSTGSIVFDGTPRELEESPDTQARYLGVATAGMQSQPQ